MFCSAIVLKALIACVYVKATPKSWRKLSLYLQEYIDTSMSTRMPVSMHGDNCPLWLVWKSSCSWSCKVQTCIDCRDHRLLDHRDDIIQWPHFIAKSLRPREQLAQHYYITWLVGEPGWKLGYCCYWLGCVPPNAHVEVLFPQEPRMCLCLEIGSLKR